ncbi:MAG: circadian clock KaiB family protein [Actinomycetes bacterium]
MNQPRSQGEEVDPTLREFERRLAEQDAAPYVLTLFVAGASNLSVRAITNVRSLCDQYLTGRYQLEVVDIHHDASTMSAHGVMAAPTLIREAPLPKRMLVGDLSDTARVLAALDIDRTAADSAS